MANIGFFTVNVIMTIVCVFLVEITGRKTLLLIAYIGMIIDTILLMLTLLFHVSIFYVSLNEQAKIFFPIRTKLNGYLTWQLCLYIYI